MSAWTLKIVGRLRYDDWRSACMHADTGTVSANLPSRIQLPTKDVAFQSLLLDCASDPLTPAPLVYSSLNTSRECCKDEGQHIWVVFGVAGEVRRKSFHLLPTDLLRKMRPCKSLYTGCIRVEIRYDLLPWSQAAIKSMDPSVRSPDRRKGIHCNTFAKVDASRYCVSETPAIGLCLCKLGCVTGCDRHKTWGPRTHLRNDAQDAGTSKVQALDRVVCAESSLGALCCLQRGSARVWVFIAVVAYWNLGFLKFTFELLILRPQFA